MSESTETGAVPGQAALDADVLGPAESDARPGRARAAGARTRTLRERAAAAKGPGAKSTSSAPPRARTRTTTTTSTRRVDIAKGMAQLYTYTGLGLSMVPAGGAGVPAAGQAMVEQAEACGQAWELLAKENPRVRVALEGFLTVSTLGVLVAAHAPIVMAGVTAAQAGGNRRGGVTPPRAGDRPSAPHTAPPAAPSVPPVEWPPAVDNTTPLTSQEAEQLDAADAEQAAREAWAREAAMPPPMPPAPVDLTRAPTLSDAG